jgi:hypothetical protein
MLMVGAVALTGCDNTPFGDAVEVDGTFLGNWTLSWEGIDAFGFPIGDESLCSGSVTLGDQSKDAFGGIFLVIDDGDCDGSPVSGSIVDGFARADGGVNFTMSREPGSSIRTSFRDAGLATRTIR